MIEQENKERFMEIQEFLDLCAGNWFSQRTSYDFNQEKSHSSQSEITIELLSQAAPEVLALCASYQIDPQVTVGGTKASWTNSSGWGQPKQMGVATIVLIPKEENPQVGRLLHSVGTTPNSLIVGHYLLGKDEALTLTLEGERTYSQERLWFASPNLRLRTSLIKRGNGWSATTFYSEIRRISG